MSDQHHLHTHAESWSVEIIVAPPMPVPFRFALFDFDGTLSLIREGWQQMMIPYFIEVLLETPGAEDADTIRRVVVDFVDRLTGKQTIFQCMRLDEEVRKRGGVPQEPGLYKAEYLRRLEAHTKERIAALHGGADPGDYLVPGSQQLLTLLKQQNLQLYLASGTDEEDVIREAKLLGLDKWFGDRIYGARDNMTDCSKELVIRDIIRENQLTGNELLSFGDGFVEIELVDGIGGYTVGVATDEAHKMGVDQHKRARLLEAGADMIIPDFTEAENLVHILMNGGQ